MWYEINNPDVKKFEDFLLHNFAHHIIEPTLRLSSIKMRWVQSVGLIPLRSCKEYPKTGLCFSKMVMSLAVSSSVNLSLIITGVSLSPFKKA
jgi:hypothetical protein